MGGRGASFINSAGDFRINVSDTFDQDEFTVKYRDNSLVEKLKKKNILVYKSCDDIPEEILFEKLAAIDETSDKFDFTLLKDKPLYIREEVFSNPRVVEAFRHPKGENRTEIILNANNITSTLERIKLSAKLQISVGFWQQCDDENLGKYTTMHEMGHYLQHCMLTSKYDDDIPKIAYTNVIKDIEKVHKRLYNTNIKSTDVSRYGSTADSEKFAELFAHINCCTKPNNAGVAFNTYLKEEGYENDNR